MYTALRASIHGMPPLFRLVGVYHVEDSIVRFRSNPVSRECRLMGVISTEILLKRMGCHQGHLAHDTLAEACG